MTLAPGTRIALAVAALAGLAGVGLDALGAHALGPAPDPARKALLDLATRYLLIHGVALLGLAALGLHSVWGRISGLGFVLGMLLFCGGLIGRALAGVSIGPLVPVGGTALLLGWAALLVHAFAGRSAGP